MIVKSDSSQWLKISKKWYNSVATKVEYLYNSLDEAKSAISEVESQGDIGSLSISITDDILEEHNEKRRKLVSFCNAIHYEVSELVDNPFSINIGNTNQRLYDLNPSDIEVVTDQVLFISQKTPLTQLIAATFIDDELKADFESRYTELDVDKPSESLTEAFDEAKFWASEFKKAEGCKEIAQGIFTDDVRERWTDMSEDERRDIINEYVNEMGKLYYGERDCWEVITFQNPSIVDDVKFDAKGYGVSRGGGEVAININFLEDPTKNYSVDKVIDTLTHEVRHEYQNLVKANPEKYGAPQSVVDEWTQTYITSDDNYDDYYKQPVEEDAKAFAALARPE